MRKKVVHIIIGLNVGGAELMLERLVINSNKSNKFSHSIISLTDLGVLGSRLKSEGIQVYSLEMTSLMSAPKTLIKLNKLLSAIKPDIVQTWMYHADLIGGLAAKLSNVKNIIWGIRNTELNSANNFSRKAIVSLCAKLSYFVPNHIVCVANTAMQKHVDQGGYDSSKTLVIPNGFDTNKFQPNLNQRNTLRSKLGIKPNDLVIGNIGRFDPVKNHEKFIKACINLMEKGYEFKVLLAGREVSLNNTVIARLFKDNSLINNFIFLGEIDDTPSFYNAIDVFCLCSSTEGFPNVLGEAMLTGKACFSTDAGDAWTILSNNGYRIKTPTTDDISAALEANIFKNTKNRLNDIGLSARESIISKYSINQIISQFESLY